MVLWAPHYTLPTASLNVPAVAQPASFFCSIALCVSSPLFNLPPSILPSQAFVHMPEHIPLTTAIEVSANTAACPFSLITLAQSGPHSFRKVTWRRNKTVLFHFSREGSSLPNWTVGGVLVQQLRPVHSWILTKAVCIKQVCNFS